MKYFIGVDIGTGSTKSVAVKTSGEAVHAAQVSYPTYTPELTYSEQAPELIWQAFVKSILRVVEEMKEFPGGIVISSAMHSVIPVDEKGNALMNMITWADNRSASIAKNLRASSLGEKIYAQSGTPIHAMTPACKIKWLKENNPELFKKVFKFVSIKEYVWFKLFEKYEVDFSIATATGLFDLETLDWNTAATEFCGIRPEHLSTPVETTFSRKSFNNLDHDLKSMNDVPFVIGASDGCLANLGSFAVAPGVAALTIGTSGAIRVASTKPTINFEAMTFNYLLTKDVFISGGPINNGGVVLKWYTEVFLRKTMKTSADYDALLQEITDVKPGSDGLIFIPYLLGERAPIWDSEACGVFFGIRNFHTQAHFTRAVVEGISMALYSIAAAMESSGLAIEQIHVSGGFVESEEWLQILADIFNKKICLINAEDASAIGAAYLGLKALNVIDDYHHLRADHNVTYDPDASKHAVYAKCFTIYKRLYQKLKEEMELVVELRS
jgi:gluconokinase